MQRVWRAQATMLYLEAVVWRNRTQAGPFFIPAAALHCACYSSTLQ